MKQKIYIDTSVIGGCFDIEFEEWSNLLFDDFKSGLKIAVISDITLDELTGAPKRVQENFKTINDDFTELILADNECRNLADLYLLEGAVSK